MVFGLQNKYNKEISTHFHHQGGNPSRFFENVALSKYGNFGYYFLLIFYFLGKSRTNWWKKHATITVVILYCFFYLFLFGGVNCSFLYCFRFSFLLSCSVIIIAFDLLLSLCLESIRERLDIFQFQQFCERFIVAILKFCTILINTTELHHYCSLLHIVQKVAWVIHGKTVAIQRLFHPKKTKKKKQFWYLIKIITQPFAKKIFFFTEI